MVGLLPKANLIPLIELSKGWEPIMASCITTNIPLHLGVIRVVAYSGIVCCYPVVIVWHVLVVSEPQHFLQHIVAEFHDLLLYVPKESIA